MHTLKWLKSLSVRILKSELEHVMTKTGFKPGETGSPFPYGAHFLTEAARGHTHLTLLASGAAGDAGGHTPPWAERSAAVRGGDQEVPGCHSHGFCSLRAPPPSSHGQGAQTLALPKLQAVVTLAPGSEQGSFSAPAGRWRAAAWPPLKPWCQLHPPQAPSQPPESACAC